MIINTNMNALNANRMVGINSTNASKAMAQLSSGLRINSAADDASGLAISEKMKGQINGLNTASSNAQTAVSLTQTADGALTETTAVLQRMRELAVQGSNDTNTTADRTAIQTETTALTAQIDNIANTTQFNTKNLLNGGAGITGTVTDGSGNALATGQQVNIAGGAAGVVAGGTLDLTGVAAAATGSVTVSGASANSAVGDDLSIGSAGAALSVNGTSVNIAAGTTGQAIADAINGVTGQTGVTATYAAADGSNAAKLTFTTTSVGSASKVDISGITASATAAVGDTFVEKPAGSAVANAISITAGTGNVAEGDGLASSASSNSIGTDATATIDSGTTGVKPTSFSANGNTITFQGGNYNGLSLQVDSTKTTGAVNVNISANNSLTMQIGANEGQTMNISINSMTSSALGVSNLNLTTQTGAEAAITAIDNATASVSNTRSQIGAYQNRLQSTINNLGTTSQNLTAAQSAITDVDMAATMAEFSKDNVESQAAQAMISQANQQPAQVLQLLR